MGTSRLNQDNIKIYRVALRKQQHVSVFSSYVYLWALLNIEWMNHLTDGSCNLLDNGNIHQI